MTYQVDAVIVVNAFGNRWNLLPLFIGRGYKVVSIIHGKSHKAFLEPEILEYATETIEYDGNIDQLIAYVTRRYRIKAVIPCFEDSIEFADELASLLGVEGNSPSSSTLRNDKYLMNESLRLSEIPCAAQSSPTNDVEQLLFWYKESGLSPVVLKPARGAWSAGVSICYNEDDIRRNFSSCHKLDRQLRQKEINEHALCIAEFDKFILQEYLEGTHYWVNCVSWQGRHYVLYIVEDIVLFLGSHAKQRNYACLLQRDTPLFKELEDYTCQVLDAVGFQYGASHNEIRMTTKGPRLIEVNPRITGGVHAGAIERAVGCSEASLLVDTVLEPSFFEHKIELLAKYPQKQFLLIYVICKEEVKIERDIDFSIFNSLKSFHSFYFPFKKGDTVYKTVSTSTIAGYIILLGDWHIDWDKESFKAEELADQFLTRLGK